MSRHTLFFIIYILFLPTGLAAQHEVPSFEDTLEVYECLFSDEEPLQLTLQFNVKEFQKTRKDEKYQPAEMTCHVNDTFRVTHPVRVKARGIYRRDNCSVPPFWLNIRYSGIETEELSDITRMKMVIRCRDMKQYRDYVLREYLVYRIYNLVTPYSFRVRLVRLKFIDTGRKNRESEDWAFLIEPDDMMANRLKATVVKSNELSMRTVNHKVMDRLAMFQYMIGNGDYSVTGRHNLRILAMETPGPLGFIPVPYDFDYTGLVNTHYAVPRESLGISSVRDRYFLGPCRNRRIHMAAVQNLATYKDEIFDLIMTFEYLDEEEKSDMVGYIESFFQEAEDERFVERSIAPTCR
jgi:hypothetical protein